MRCNMFYLHKKREKIYLGWLMMGCFGCLIGGCDERSSADFFLICRELDKISKQHTLCFNKIKYKFKGKKTIFFVYFQWEFKINFENLQHNRRSNLYDLYCINVRTHVLSIGCPKVFHQSNQYSIIQTHSVAQQFSINF